MNKLEQRIKNKDYRVREKVARFLGRRKSIKGACKLLVRLLSDKESLVRSAALISLRRIGNKKYSFMVLPLLNDRDEVVRVDAVECVAWLGGKKALKYLINHLNDKSGLVRRYIGGSIGDLGDKTHIKYLETRLINERSGLAKVGLLEGLYLLGQKDRILELIRLLKSKNYRVRCATASTLTSMANRKNKNLIIDALLKALENETTIGGKERLEDALNYLQKRYKADKFFAC